MIIAGIEPHYVPIIYHPLWYADITGDNYMNMEEDTMCWNTQLIGQQLTGQQLTGQQTHAASSLYIRDALISDVEALQRLYHLNLGTHEAYDLESIKESIETDNIYVAFNGEGSVIGTITSAKVFDPNECSAKIKGGVIHIGPINMVSIGNTDIVFDYDVKHELRGLCVDEAYRRKGVATALLGHAINNADGSAYAFVWAPGGNIRAQGLWEKFGFELKEKIENLGKEVPWFCGNCVERKHGCDYCDSHVYVWKNASVF